MASLQQTLASWATILGSALSLIGLLQSRAWLTTTSVLFVAAALVTGIYARKQRLVLSSASIEIDGRSIDSLNAANLNRRVNRSLVIQEVSRVATIRGQDLTISAEYAGYACAQQESAIELSVDTDNNVPFTELDCFAYDLQHDPARKHRIRPLIVGTDGMSKKIAVPFLEPVHARQRFSVQLQCNLPGCMKTGLEYYAATLSFNQDQIPLSTVRLQFMSDFPEWVRVYDVAGSGKPTLLRDLQPTNSEPEIRQYIDVAENVEGRSSRVYLFRRSEPQASRGVQENSAMSHAQLRR